MTESPDPRLQLFILMECAESHGWGLGRPEDHRFNVGQGSSTPVAVDHLVSAGYLTLREYDDEQTGRRQLDATITPKGRKQMNGLVVQGIKPLDGRSV